MLKALDLFCGAGAATVGMRQAGYEVTGVDIVDQPYYPARFIQGDALDLAALGIRLCDYDLVWASPPCQAFSMARSTPWLSTTPAPAPDLIQQTRQLLAGHPTTIIENVPGAPLRKDVVLVWDSFQPNAPLPRKRIFELSFPPPLVPPPHRRTEPTLISAYGYGGGGGGPRMWKLRKAHGLPQGTSIAELRQAFGAWWLPLPRKARTGNVAIQQLRQMLNQMIPPIYASFLAHHAEHH